MDNQENWSDTNRFNQSGYSAITIFPQKENYTNEDLYNEDLAKANEREEAHQEFLYDLREEHRMEDRCCDYEDCDEDYEDCEDEG